MNQLPTLSLHQVTGEILVVSPDRSAAQCIESHLRKAGHPLRVSWIADAEELPDLLRHNPPQVVLCDVRRRPDKVIGQAAQLSPDLPVIVISSERAVEDVAAALSAGAQDFASYSTPCHLRHLELVVVREFVKYHNLCSLHQAQRRLADLEVRHQRLAEGTADAVAHVREGIVASANLAFTRLLGYGHPAELAGVPLADLVAAEQRNEFKEYLRGVLNGKHGDDTLELILAGCEGQPKIRAQMIFGNQEGENVIELLIHADDAAAEPELARTGEGCATAGSDARGAAVQMTPGQATLCGRWMFSAALEAAPQGKQQRTALLLRIDGFDALEQRFGHADAQEVTSLLAGLVQGRLGPRDSAFVFSTDELALLVQRPSHGETEEFTELLHREISEYIFATRQHEAQIKLTIATYPMGKREAPEQVIRQLADEARKVSARGGNRIVTLGATAKAIQFEREEARRAAQVREAIEENRLKLAYQPIASLEGESRSHSDVQLRMVDKAGREQYASEFLPTAQKFNLMGSIDRWVVSQALGVIARRAASKEASVLFVKLSEDTVKDSDGFIGWLTTVTLGQPLHSDQIVFELQEMVIRNHVRKAKALMQALREMGAGLAVEHYGIDAASVELLDHVPLDFVKFHASFTQKLGDKETQKHLLHLIDVAKQHKLKTIVSHVEDAHVTARLWQMGVNFVQGYHVQEPEVVLLSSDSLGYRTAACYA